MNSPPSLASDVLVQWGGALAQARVLRAMTQAELAQACGVSRRAIQRLEAGENVALELWVTVAQHLGYLADLMAVMAYTKPTTMAQFQALAQGRPLALKRARK